MNIGNSAALGMAKVNWKHSRTVYLIVFVMLLVGMAGFVIELLKINPPGNETVALANYLYILPLFMGILVPALNFSKLINLGGKRIDFYKSALLTYAPPAAAVSLVNVVFSKTLDKWLLAHTRLAGMLDCMDVFGFMGRGPVAAFLQMTAFLLLVSCIAHTLTLIQGKWYGWFVDALIIYVISAFSLSAPMAWFFQMIIFHNVWIVQVLSCVVVGAVVYGASIVPIRSRVI